MPELPDIVAYIESLEHRIVGEKLNRIHLRSPFLLRTVEPSVRQAQGRRTLGLQRIGKRIAIELESELFLVFHLMIAGRFQWRPFGSRPPAKRALATFEFSSGTLVLTEAGSRRRASLHLVQGREALRCFDRGGLEVMEANLESFQAALTGENHTLKRALTDPRLFSGIGNAYSDEILHRAHLSPMKLTQRLTQAEVEVLYEATLSTLREWTERLCSRARDDFPKKVTAFHPEMAVHGRFREPCPVCGSAVQRIVYAENECNYCPTCQTNGRLLADRALSRLLKKDWPRTLEELEGRTDQSSEVTKPSQSP